MCRSMNDFSELSAKSSMKKSENTSEPTISSELHDIVGLSPSIKVI